MGYDCGIEPFAVYELYPRHVHLYKCRTSPLPRFKEYHAYGLSGDTHSLEFFQYFPLWAVECERYIPAPFFILDVYVAVCPETEVMLYAQLYELLYHGFACPLSGGVFRTYMMYCIFYTPVFK